MDWKSKAQRLLGNRTHHIHGDGQFAFVTPCRNREFSLWERKHSKPRTESCAVEAIALV